MDIKRKIEIAETAIKSISEHRDEDAAVRNAALNLISAAIERERVAIETEINQRIASTITG